MYTRISQVIVLMMSSLMRVWVFTSPCSRTSCSACSGPPGPGRSGGWKEHRVQVLLRVLDRDRLTRLDHRVDPEDRIILGDLVLLGGLLGELHLFTLEAVQDDRGVQRVLVVEVDEVDLLDARVHRAPRRRGGGSCRRPVELFLRRTVFDADPAREVAADEPLLVLAGVGDLHLLDLVEKLDDRLARLVAQGPEEDRREDPLLAVDLRVISSFFWSISNSSQDRGRE